VSRPLEPAAATAALSHDQPLALSLAAHRENRDGRVRLRLGGQCPTMPGELVVLLDGDRAIAGCVDPQILNSLKLSHSGFLDDAAFSLRGDEVERLEVKGLGADWTLTRDGSGFRLSSMPDRTVALDAGNALLDSLVSVRGTPVGGCEFSALRDRRTTALRSFVVGDDKPCDERVVLGNVAADGSRRVCRDDNTELLVPPNVAPLLDLDPTLLEDPTLVDVALESIVEVRIETPSGRLLLRADDRGQLTQVNPRGGPADEGAIETLRERLAELRVTRWLSPTAARTTATRAFESRIEFVVSATSEPKGSAPPSPVRHQLRLLLDEQNAAPIGWFDKNPTPFRLDAAFGRLVAQLTARQSIPPPSKRP